MIKRYKDGAFVEIPQEELEMLEKRNADMRAKRRKRREETSSVEEYESRIKALEETIAKLLPKEETTTEP